MFTFSVGEFQIMEYTNSRLVVINTGSAKIQTGVFKLIHTIDLEKYEDLIKNLESGIDFNKNTDNQLLPYLSYSISQMKSCLSRLKSKTKTKRSLDFIGSAWKWLAGNPDHQDFEIVENKMNNVLKNNNNQIVINQLTIEKINKLSIVTNNISKLVENRFNEEKLLDFKYKLEIVKDELSNIEYAIHWAKANIVNSFIFSNIEIDVLRDIFYNDNIPFGNIDELLNFSKIKIASNSKEIVYIVNIPTTSNENCDNFSIRPVKRNNIVIKTNFKTILKCYDKIFGIKNDCKNYNKLSICETDNIIDISETDCIPNLLKSKPFRCTTTNNEHVAQVEKIDDSMVLLNEFEGQVEIDNSTINLNGTFIIHHLNSTVRIGNKTYLTTQATLTKPLPALLQPGNISFQEQVITLERMEAVNVNNSHLIEKLQVENKINLFTNFGLIIAISLLVTIVCIMKRNKKVVTETENKPFEKVSQSPKEGGKEDTVVEANLGASPEVSLALSSKKGQNQRIHNLPFF